MIVDGWRFLIGHGGPRLREAVYGLIEPPHPDTLAPGEEPSQPYVRKVWLEYRSGHDEWHYATGGGRSRRLPQGTSVIAWRPIIPT